MILQILPNTRRILLQIEWNILARVEVSREISAAQNLFISRAVQRWISTESTLYNTWKSLNGTVSALFSFENPFSRAEKSALNSAVSELIFSESALKTSFIRAKKQPKYSSASSFRWT